MFGKLKGNRENKKVCMCGVSMKSCRLKKFSLRNMEISRLDSLRLGSSKEDKFLGGEHITFRGTEWH